MPPAGYSSEKAESTAISALGFIAGDAELLPRFLAIVIVIGFTAMNYEWMPFVIFLSYLLYGFLRPFLSRKMKKEIEEELEDEDDDEDEEDQVPVDSP